MSCHWSAGRKPGSRTGRGVGTGVGSRTGRICGRGERGRKESYPSVNTVRKKEKGTYRYRRLDSRTLSWPLRRSWRCSTALSRPLTTCNTGQVDPRRDIRVRILQEGGQRQLLRTRSTVSRGHGRRERRHGPEVRKIRTKKLISRAKFFIYHVIQMPPQTSRAGGVGT